MKGFIASALVSSLMAAAAPPNKFYATVQGRRFEFTRSRDSCQKESSRPCFSAYAGIHYDESGGGIEYAIHLSFLQGDPYPIPPESPVTGRCAMVDFQRGAYDSESVLVNTTLIDFDDECDSSINLVIKEVERLDGSGNKVVSRLPHRASETKPLHEAYAALLRQKSIADELCAARYLFDAPEL